MIQYDCITDECKAYRTSEGREKSTVFRQPFTSISLLIYWETQCSKVDATIHTYAQRVRRNGSDYDFKKTPVLNDKRKQAILDLNGAGCEYNDFDKECAPYVKLKHDKIYIKSECGQ